MYDQNGAILGATTSAILLPATASAITGVNYFILLFGFITILLLGNLIVKLVTKRLAK